MTLSPFSSTWRTDVARKLNELDPNGTLGELANLDSVENLGELAKLVLTANKVLTTNNNGELTQSDITDAARVLLKLVGTAAGNKLPYFNGTDSAVLTDFTAAARALLNLTGSAAANQLPYFTGANGAGLTPLTAFARTLLSKNNADEVWAALGGASGGSSYTRLPDGTMFQRATVVSTTTTGGFIYAAFPISFINANYQCVAWNGDRTTVPNIVYPFDITGASAGQAAFRATNPTNGTTYNSTTLRINVLAMGRWK